MTDGLPLLASLVQYTTGSRDSIQDPRRRLSRRSLISVAAWLKPCPYRKNSTRIPLRQSHEPRY